MARTKKQTFVSQADFARVVGVSRARITQAIKHGKLDGALVEAGRGRKINLEKGLELWGKNLAPAQQIGGLANQAKARAKQGGGRGTASRKPKAPAVDPKPKAPAKKNINSMSLAELQTLQARYKTLTQKLEFDERVKKVIPIEQAEREFFDLARLTRDALLAIPDKLSAILAAEDSERRVNAMLTEALHEALKGLKRRDQQ